MTSTSVCDGLKKVEDRVCDPGTLGLQIFETIVHVCAVMTCLCMASLFSPLKYEC